MNWNPGRWAWLAAPVGVALTFTLGRHYKPMIYGEIPAGSKVWGYIIGSTFAGIVALCLTGAGRAKPRSTVFGLLLLHNVANTAAFCLARSAAIHRADWEHAWEEFEVMTQTLALGAGSLVASIILLFMLVRRIPDPSPGWRRKGSIPGDDP